MRLGVALSACLLVLSVAGAADAGRTELVVGAAVVAPAASPYPEYRFFTEQLGYDRRGLRQAYELEAGALREFNRWLSAGPLVRGYYGSLEAPYEGLPAITTFSGSLAARVEVDLFPWPRLFLWADPSIGIGSIGVSGARSTVGFWGVRGGIGIGTARDSSSIRFRFGYGYAPTFDRVTHDTGRFDWGGFTFQLDGVFRVAK